MSNFIKDFYWTICSILFFGFIVGGITAMRTPEISFWSHMITLGILSLVFLVPFLAGREHR